MEVKQTNGEVISTYEKQGLQDRRINPMKRLKFDLLAELSACLTGINAEQDSITRAIYIGKMKGIQRAINLINRGMVG